MSGGVSRCCGPPISMSASLTPIQRVRTVPFGGIPGIWIWLVLFCFAIQNAMCQSTQNPQDCGNQTPCAEELDQPGCSEGHFCPSTPLAACPPGTFLSKLDPQKTPLCQSCPQGFFNSWPGQDACFPCGSEATQPEEGQDTCVCRGPGRVFQPSDGQCPCLPGYRDVGEPRGCVQREQKICKDGATSNQEGLCLTKDQWGDHCAHEVCAAPEDARGYDPVLGLCLCWGQQSGEVCGALCPEERKHMLHLSCPEGMPKISFREDAGSQDFYLLDRPSSPRAEGHPCNLGHGQDPVPVYVIKLDGNGFLALRRPGRELLLSFGLSLGGPKLPDQDVEMTEEGPLTNSTHPEDLSPPELGIRNPTVCLQPNDTLAFLVTPEHYPEYDLSHYYNTQRDFDWGRFRALDEESQLQQQNPYLFLQQFQQPGVYVFRLSSNRHRKMYIRTLPPGGLCLGEGPFTTTTPRHLIQTGIAKIPRPQKPSDWPIVLGVTAVLLGLCLLLLIQCHSLSWARKATPNPIFRKHQQGYNLDVYTSRRTGLISVRRGRSQQAPDSLTGGNWEAEEEVDLESFDTETFFGILLRQSLSVTTKLSQTKEELKLLYLKLVSEVRALRQLWGAKQHIPASSDLLGKSQSKQQQAAEAAARAAEEARRRRQLAGEYAASLRRQLKLLRQDLRARQENWASFSSALAAAQRLLKLQTGCRPLRSCQAGQNPEGHAPQLDTVLDHLSQALLQEGHRLNAWGVLGSGTGAELLRPGDGDDISVNPVTKLLVPGTKCQLLPAEGHKGPIPPGYFLHPDTGRVLPEAGNLGYDLQGAALVPTTDVCAGAVRTSEAAILPYVPYPTCPDTGSPPAPCLPILQPRRTSQLGALMTDPRTGIEVPVLAVTLHPQTRQWLTLGGTYCNPLTKTLTPLELGAPMEDPVTRGIAPILGVGLDESTGLAAALTAVPPPALPVSQILVQATNCTRENFLPSPISASYPRPIPSHPPVPNLCLREGSKEVGWFCSEGQVIPLGGLRDASGNLLLPGDSFVEPLSRKPVQVQGACRQKGQTLPHAGGPQALLNANVLVAQRQVVALLQQCQEKPGLRVQGLLKAANKDMRKALSLSLYHTLQQARRLEKQLELADGIEASGGRIGTMCYPGTEIPVPILYGMKIPDPEGSGLSVPILGIEIGEYSVDDTPLAGSMEDVNGKGLVPISIGAQAIHPLTEEPGPVIGAQRDPSTKVVVPIVQMLEALPREVRDPRLLDILERELRFREQYWHRQEQAEQQLAEDLQSLSQELHYTPGKDLGQQLRVLVEACTVLESCCLQETERRATALSTQDSPMPSLLSRADREEWEQEAQVAQAMKKFLQSLAQVAEKLKQAVSRLQGQEEESQLQQSQSQSPQIWNPPRKVVQHLSDEFQEILRKRQNILDRALGQLQYQRELSRLQLLHTQIAASGTPVCLENYPSDRFYGTITSSLRGQAAACPLLIPFLKSLTAALVNIQGHGLGLEDQGPGTEAERSDIQWILPLLSSLSKGDVWFKAHMEGSELQGPAPKSSLHDPLKLHTMQKEELVTVPSIDLSAREFVVYQYGLSVLHLLIPQIHAPEITLQIASHLPAMEASDNAFQGSFLYQVLLQIQVQIYRILSLSAENTLFVRRECLASVGSFILLLIHSLAHITAKDLRSDFSSTFQRLFYKGLKAYFQEAFSITLQMSAASWDSKLNQNISAILLEEHPISERGRDLLSKLFEARCESPLAPESSEEYIKKYKDLLLFTNMEHFLKSILAAEQQVPRRPRD